MAKLTLPHFPLGQTELAVSPLGWGTVKIGRNQKVKYPEGENYPLPSDREVEKLLELCLEFGINLIDTAPAYGCAEERLGKLLGTARREQFCLFSKTGEEFKAGESHYNFSREYTQKSIERSLRRLNTDYLDGVLVHCSKNDLDIIRHTPVLETLAACKQMGKIRSFGVSTMSLEGGLQAVEMCDIVMVSYNPLYTKEKPVIDKASRLNKGVFIKKGFCSGHLAQLEHPQPLQFCLEDILRLPAAKSLIFGSLTPKHVEENARLAWQVLSTL